MKCMNDTNRDRWLDNVKDVLTMVSKCINGERYTEAAQLVFAVNIQLIIIQLLQYSILYPYFLISDCLSRNKI